MIMTKRQMCVLFFNSVPVYTRKKKPCINWHCKSWIEVQTRVEIHHWQCPAPENLTHLSHQWVRWDALYIEWSPHFDIRRRLQSCNPVNPQPPTFSFSPSPYVSVTYSRTHRFERCWQLLAFYFAKLFRGMISRTAKVGGNKREGDGGERETEA